MEFEKIIEDILNNNTVKKMKNYQQHYDTNCFDHCKNVAYYTYLICKKYHLDYVSATRAAMLHDLFLYDWRVKSVQNSGLHGLRHPKVAFENARNLFDLNEKEQDIILKHMWPVTFKLPKYKESFIVGMLDKYSTLSETIAYYRKTKKLQKLYRYAYVFVCLLIVRLV